MQKNKGMSIFWLGLLGILFFPLGILSIVFGLIQIKKKVATVWTKVGLALGFVSVIFAILIIAMIPLLLPEISHALENARIRKDQLQLKSVSDAFNNFSESDKKETFPNPKTSE